MQYISSMREKKNINFYTRIMLWPLGDFEKSTLNPVVLTFKVSEHRYLLYVVYGANGVLTILAWSTPWSSEARGPCPSISTSRCRRAIPPRNTLLSCRSYRTSSTRRAYNTCQLCPTARSYQSKVG